MHRAGIAQPRTAVRTIARVCVVWVVRRKGRGLRSPEHKRGPRFAVATKPIDGRLDVWLKPRAHTIALYQMTLRLASFWIGGVKKIGSAVAVAGRPSLRRRRAVVEWRIQAAWGHWSIIYGCGVLIDPLVHVRSSRCGYFARLPVAHATLLIHTRCSIDRDAKGLM